MAGIDIEQQDCCQLHLSALKGKGQVDNVIYLCKCVKKSICLSLKMVFFKSAGSRTFVSADRYAEGGGLSKRLLPSQDSAWKQFVFHWEMGRED